MENDDLVREIVSRVVAALGERGEMTVPVEISARHVHLSRGHVDRLFGPGHELTPKRPLSQPGQFLCEERVTVMGPNGALTNVAILGPVRNDTQVELSAGDARTLGIDAPVRMSGDLSGAAGVVICAGGAVIEAPGSAIIARNHIHMTPADAARYGVRDRDEVAVRVRGRRALVFEQVPVRVSDAFALAMHIDFDEANACLCDRKAFGVLVGKTAAEAARPETDAKRVLSTVETSLAVCSKSDAGVGNIVATAGKKANRVVSAEVARELVKAGAGAPLPKGCIVTPLARDVFAAAGLKVRGGGKDEPCLCAR